jgi:hypothetical protein
LSPAGNQSIMNVTFSAADTAAVAARRSTAATVLRRRGDSDLQADEALSLRADDESSMSRPP